jgi:hypothetical protein
MKKEMEAIENISGPEHPSIFSERAKLDSGKIFPRDRKSG